MKRQQDVSGRATIAPDPTLSMDEIGVPADMLWGMYGKFVVGRLVRRGYGATEAQKMVEDKTPIALHELINESKERPVIVNRAPSLHRFNVIGAYPRITTGKTITLNPFAEKGTNADYDGDAMQIHAPVTPAAVADVKNMTLSKLLFADRKPGVLNVAPDMEAVLGLHRATQAPSNKKVRHFESTKDALAAYHRGEINLNDPVKIDD
jgi:DNA-directed RNA polymerase subunit beta'